MCHKPIFLLLLLCLILLGCERNNYQSLGGQTMGTTYTEHFKPEKTSTTPLQQAIDQRLADINQKMSTYIDDSELNQLNQYTFTDCHPVSSDLFKVLESALQINKLSSGAFDPSIGPLIELWGFDRKETHNEIPSDDLILEAQRNVAYMDITVNAPKLCIHKATPAMKLNLSAIAKGYAVDEVAALLENTYNIHHYLVEIGGEVKVKGKNTHGIPWRVAIEAPLDNTRKVQKVINPGIMGVATSGDYRNYFEKDGKRYSHVIDPRTGKPIDHNLASVTVIHPSAMIAEGLATAFMVMGPKRAMKMARERNIALYMLVKTPVGFIEQMNDAFIPYLSSDSRP